MSKIQTTIALPESIFLPSSNLEQVIKSEHLVQFYETDEFLVNSVHNFIRKGDFAVVIATKQHRELLEKELKLHNFDIIKAKLQGHYVALDAEETLSKFMVNGIPDSQLFFDVIGKIIISVANGKNKVRAFGEMVALLWKEGNQAGAIRLEQLWNNLQKHYSFSLLCGYSMNNFDGNIHAIPFNEVCLTHSHVLPTEKYSSLQTEEERMREIAMLQQKAKSLEEEIERRKQLENQKDEFMAVVSHELKTPVTSIKAYTQVLHKNFQKKGDIKAATSLGKMGNQINKLTSLIEDLLDVTKIEAGKLQFRQQQFNIHELVEEIIDEIKHTTTHKIIKKGTINTVIHADRERIGQAVTNFLTNAIKYSPTSDKIVVSLKTNTASVTISVQDFGLGINKKQLPYVFDRFFREPGVKQETFPGLGLGLYISSEIIKRHNGRIWVESEKGAGSTFSFSLPIGL